VVFLFAATIFLSALLLFWIQLVMAKMLLPASGRIVLIAREAGVSIKPGAQAPGSLEKKAIKPAKAGDSGSCCV